MHFSPRRSLWTVAAIAGFSLLCVVSVQATAEDVPAQPILRIETGMHTAPIKRFSISPNNHFLATVSDDKTVRIWSLSDGMLVDTFRVPIAHGPEGALYAVAFMPTGKALLTGGYTGFTWDRSVSIYLLDFPDGSIKGRRLQNFPGTINHLSFHIDAGGKVKYMAVAFFGSYSGVYFYNNRVQRIAKDTDYQGQPYSVEFAPDGRAVVAAADGDVRLYGHDLQLVKRVAAPGGQEPSVARFSPDGRQIAIGYWDKARVDIVSANDLAIQVSLLASGSAGTHLNALAWVPRGDDMDLVAGGDLKAPSGEKIIRRWSGLAYRDIPVSREVITQLEAMPDGRIIFASADPSWGVIAADDGVSPNVRGVKPDFRLVFQGTFALSHDGTAVDFGIEAGGQRPLRFDFVTQRLTPDPPERSDMVPPLQPSRRVPVKQWGNSQKPVIGRKSLSLAPYELSRSVAVHPDKRRFLLGADFHLYLFDRKGRELDKREINSAAFGVAISGDGRRAVAALGDGTLRWYSLEPGHELEELAALFVHVDGIRWIAWTPEGLFVDSEQGGNELAGYHVNVGPAETARWITFNQLARSYYEPELVRDKVLGSSDDRIAQKMQAVGKVHQEILDQPPPVIKLEEYCLINASKSPENCFPMRNVRRGIRRKEDDGISRGILATDELLVRFSIMNSVDDLQDIDLVLNGRTVHRDNSRALRRKSVDKVGVRLERLVKLDPGINRLHIRAYNNSDISGRSEEVVFRVPEPAVPEKPDLYVVTVGIDSYGGEEISPLNFAVADSSSFARKVEALKPDEYENFHLAELNNAKATRANLRAVLAEIADKAQSRDSVLIYLAGHGLFEAGTYYFVTYDVTAVDEVRNKALGHRELIDWLVPIGAQNKFLFLDTCHSGAFSSSPSGNIANEVGSIYVLTASASEQEALDSYDGNNGLFAYVVLEGLTGKAATMEGLVKALNLGAYVRDRVEILAARRNFKQEARFKTTSGDALPFWLTRVQ